MKRLSNPATFFGSGPVAAKSLELLLNWLDIELVVTKRTPPHHKDPAPVETLAKNRGLSIEYASTKKELDTLLDKGNLSATEYAIVIDYGVIISQKVIDYYPKGIINSHFSLLPEWRGADPISFAILSGQSKTGVSLMLIDSGMDTGQLFAQQDLVIDNSDTNDRLTSKLINLSDNLLQHNLPKYLNNHLEPYKQNGIATYSTMLNKNDGLIDTSKPASVLEREIRAFLPWPGCRLQLKDNWLTITKATVTQSKTPQGQIVAVDKKLFLGCKNSALEILEIKPAGKKNMSTSAFINGYSHYLS